MKERNLALMFEQATHNPVESLALMLLGIAVSMAQKGEQYCGVIVGGETPQNMNARELIIGTSDIFQQLGFQTDEHHSENVPYLNHSHRLTIFWGEGKSRFEQDRANTINNHDILYLE